jgi:hypothetical protein
MLCLLLGILLFPIVLPFLILRFVLKLLFAIVMVPFVLFVVAGALFIAFAGAFAGVLLALFSPLLPLAFVALVIWAVTRHSRAASVIPG